MALAVRYFQQAASNGDSDACVQMGILFRDGQGLKKDLAEAVALFQIAADRENRNGSFLLGLCYQRGEGVEKKSRRGHATLPPSIMNMKRVSICHVGDCKKGKLFLNAELKYQKTIAIHDLS